jgi:hypothetical protein
MPQLFKPTTDADYENLYAAAKPLWYTSITTDELAKELNVSVREIYRLTARYNLKPRLHVKKKKVWRKGVPDPTPEEIQQRVKEIQAGWSDEDRALRSVKKPVPAAIKNFSYRRDACHFIVLSHPEIIEYETA